MIWHLLFCDTRYEIADCASIRVPYFRSSAEGDPVEGLLPGARRAGEAGEEGPSLQAVGRRHGVADVSPQKRLKGASPGGGGCGRAPCSGFLRLPRPVGTDGRRAYAMPPFLRGTPAVGPGGRNLPAVRAGQKGMAAGMGTDRLFCR